MTLNFLKSVKYLEKGSPKVLSWATKIPVLQNKKNSLYYLITQTVRLIKSKIAAKLSQRKK